MFIAAFFVIAHIWKQRRYPLTDDWITKMWYTLQCGCPGFYRPHWLFNTFPLGFVCMGGL